MKEELEKVKLSAIRLFENGLAENCADDFYSIGDLEDNTCDYLELIPILEKIAGRDLFCYWDDNGAGGAAKPDWGTETSFRERALKAIENIKENTRFEADGEIAQALKSNSPMLIKIVLDDLGESRCRDQRLIAILEKIAKKNTYSQSQYKYNSIELEKPARKAIRTILENHSAALTVENIEPKDYEEQIRRFSQYLELDPTNSAAFKHRGIIYHKINRTAAALEDFDRAISVNPENLEAYQLKAEIFKESGEPQKLIEVYTQAIENLSDDLLKCAAYRRRAAAYFEMNLPQEAVADFTKAIENSLIYDKNFGFGETNPHEDLTRSIRLERGNVYYRTGNKNNAFADLEYASYQGENLDWSPVLDIVLAEPELQKAQYKGFSNLLFTVSSLITAAGKPVFGDCTEEEKLHAFRENRLMEVYAEGYVENNMKIKFSFPPFINSMGCQQSYRYLLFPKPIPPELRSSYYTPYKTVKELEELFNRFD